MELTFFNIKKTVSPLGETEENFKEKDMAETMNLMDGLIQEMNRAREVKKLYDEIPEGRFGSAMIQHTITRAEKSISSGDVVEMLLAYQELKDIQ